jgi:hypothetical protein
MTHTAPLIRKAAAIGRIRSTRRNYLTFAPRFILKRMVLYIRNGLIN